MLLQMLQLHLVTLQPAVREEATLSEILKIKKKVRI